MHSYVALICAAATCCVVGTLLSAGEGPTASAFPVEELPAGYVRGDVVSYSYVPNRYWGRGWGENLGTLFYIDKKLIHYTPEHPEGIAYTDEQLESYREHFIASRMRMFNDVVYNQFGHLNGLPPKR